MKKRERERERERKKERENEKREKGLLCCVFELRMHFDEKGLALKIFNLGARRGGDVHFLIGWLYITVLD